MTFVSGSNRSSAASQSLRGALRARQAKLLEEVRAFTQMARGVKVDRRLLMSTMEGIYHRMCGLCSEEEIVLRALRHPSLEQHSEAHMRLRADIAVEMRSLAWPESWAAERVAHIFDALVIHLAVCETESLLSARPGPVAWRAEPAALAPSNGHRVPMAAPIRGGAEKRNAGVR